MNHVYTFNDEESLTNKIDELKLQNTLPSNMTVLGIKRPNGVFRNYHDVEFVKANGSIWEKLVAKLFDSNRYDLVMRRFDLNDEEKSELESGVQSGKYVLLVKEQMSEKYDGVSEEEVRRRKKEHHEASEDTHTEEEKKKEHDKELEQIYDEYGLNSERVIEKR